ncbi:MAG: beta-eliminating lyase-related protein [Vicinamibacterales bacterium]
MNFRSDNVLGCAPEILDALARVNDTPTHPYGNDPVTARLDTLVSTVFERDVQTFPVATGTAANGLSLAAITPSWGAIYCHPQAHLLRDEWCAPEFFTGGARLLPVEGEHGKIDPDALSARIADTIHSALPATVSLTQATECGTVYRPDEIAALVDRARGAKLAVHMDGARFANALVALACAPADLTWRLGVDAMALGATKNGTLGAELVVVFRPELAAEIAHRRKRAGHVPSKMRFLSAQIEAYFTDDLWLRHARQANAAAHRLATGLAGVAGVTLVEPVETNQVFARFPPRLRSRLRERGFAFLDWPVLGPDAVRLVAGFATTEGQVDAFTRAAREATAGA